MVPQDDLAVFSSSGQESATPHLTHAENAALVSFDLSSDLERCPDTDLFVWTTWYHHITSHHMSLVLHNLVLVLGLSPLGPFPVVVSLGFLVQTSRTPPESPVRMSPELRKDRHWMNFGFSYFWKKKGKETGLRLGLDQALDQFNLDSKGEADLTQDYRHETGLHRNTRKYRLCLLFLLQKCPVYGPVMFRSRSRRRCETSHR